MFTDRPEYRGLEFRDGPAKRSSDGISIYLSILESFSIPRFDSGTSMKGQCNFASTRRKLDGIGWRA